MPRLIPLAALAALVAHPVIGEDTQSCVPNDGEGNADYQDETTGLMQIQRARRAMAVLNTAAVCSVGDHVQCPGSAAWCSGEQCCPGLEGAPSFPCPSAPEGWSDCGSHIKVQDCTALQVAAPTCSVGDHVSCPGSAAQCAGNQCCPSAAGGTFPCPSAENSWMGCTSHQKVEDCTTGSTASTSTTMTTTTTSSSSDAPTTTTKETTTTTTKKSESTTSGGLTPGGSRLKVTNGCSTDTIWIASMLPESVRSLYPTNLKLLPGEEYTYVMPGQTTVAATRFWPKMGCDSNGEDCTMGSSGGPGQACPVGGCAPPVDSKFEATFWDFNTAERVDWWDTSGVDGYTLPYKLELDSNCPNGKSLDCSELLLSECPRDEILDNTSYDLLVHDLQGNVDGCYSPCGKLTYSNWGNSPTYAPADKEAQMYCCPTPPISSEQCRQGPVEQTKYVALFREKCKSVYSYAYDDAVGLQTCPVGTTYHWTVYCPDN